MQRFLFKLAKFIFVLFVVLFLCYLGNRKILSENKYYVDDSVQTIILGTSMARDGINPEVFDNAVNIGSDSEPFVLSYLKLKDVLKKPHSLETVILSCSYSEIFSIEENNFKDRANATEFYRRITFYNELPSFSFFRPFTNNFLFYYEMIIRNRIMLFPALSNYGIGDGQKKTPHIMGYSHVNQAKTPEVINGENGGEEVNYKEYARKYDNSLIKNEWNDLSYVDSIIHFAEAEELNLVLVGMPINKNLFSEISNECKMKFDLIKQRFNQYEHVKFLDLSNSIDDPYYFRDHVHLRSFGADSISKVIYNHIYQ